MIDVFFIVFMIVATIFAFVALGYVIVDLIIEKRNKKKAQNDLEEKKEKETISKD